MVLRSIVCFSILAVTSFAVSCPQNAVYGSTDGMCYLKSTTSATWGSAVEFCRAAKGDLALPRNSFENSGFTAQMEALGSSGSWIGAYSEANGVWFDTNVQKIAYTRWASGQPQYNSACGLMTIDGNWYSQLCDRSKPFICRIAPSNQ